MADNPPKFNFDIVANSSTLDLLVGGVFETAYSYANDVVTLSVRLSDTDIALTNLRDNVHNIGVWQSFISNHLEIDNSNETNYHSILDWTSSNHVTCLLEIGIVTVITADCKLSNGVTTFLARPQVVLSWRDFGRFVKTLQTFISEIDRLR